jgi:hypothetical protein
MLLRKVIKLTKVIEKQVFILYLIFEKTEPVSPRISNPKS